MNALRATRLLAGAMAAVTLLAACGKTTTHATATPAPTQFIPFPTNDMPLSAASGAQQQVWSAYQVQTIPGTGALVGTPTAPPPVNDTNGAVPNDVAQEWATAFYRDAAWRKWALAHAQGDFLTHLDGLAYQSTYLKEGQTENIPDCALYPASLTLLTVPPDPSGVVQGSDQYAFLATYNPPPGQPCTVNFKQPEGQLNPDFAFSAPYEVVYKGWVHEDAMLGNIWISDSQSHCDYLCPVPPKQYSTVPPAFPDDDTNILQATQQQQVIWASYSVQFVPRKGVVAIIPKAPKVTNETNGVIPDATASQWAQAFYQQSAWMKWSEEQLQTHFQVHIGDSTAFNTDLYQTGHLGGVPAMPSCAVYPTGMTLKYVSDAERRSGGINASHDAFMFDVTYAQPCKVPVTFPDGTTQTVTIPKEILSVGSIRDDPLLGTIWYPDAANIPPAYTF